MQGKRKKRFPACFNDCHHVPLADRFPRYFLGNSRQRQAVGVEALQVGENKEAVTNFKRLYELTFPMSTQPIRILEVLRMVRYLHDETPQYGS